MIGVLVALFAFAGSAAAMTGSGGTGTDPWIASDLPDYPPGATVTLLGGSWQPGESIHINVNDEAGQTWMRNSDLTADVNGDITDTFTLPDWFVATYSVTVTGAVSGTATTSFTDGNVTLHPAPAGDGVTQYRVTYDLWNGTSTTCGGVGPNSPPPSSANLTLDVTSPNSTNNPRFGGFTA